MDAVDGERLCPNDLEELPENSAARLRNDRGASIQGKEPGSASASVLHAYRGHRIGLQLVDREFDSRCQGGLGLDASHEIPGDEERVGQLGEQGPDKDREKGDDDQQAAENASALTAPPIVQHELKLFHGDGVAVIRG